MQISEINFKAEWNETNRHLRTPTPDLFGRIQQIAWNIFSVCIPVIGVIRLIGYEIGQIANRMTLPAAHKITKERLIFANAQFDQFWFGPITEQNKLLRDFFSVERHRVVTPDGVSLHAIAFKHRDAMRGQTPTVIFFNGNFQLSVQTPTWPLEQAIDTNTTCNFVLFDYRGVGDSQGKFEASKDLIVDGSSIVQWVHQRIGTPLSKIHFYGYSLGGAVAALTQALDPDHLTGHHINERSFASSKKMIEDRFGKGLLGKILTWIFQKQGYSANPAAAFEKLKGKKLIIYHPEDRVISSFAGMHNNIEHDDILKLCPKPEFIEDSSKKNHIAPLYWHEGALEYVIQFLFNPSLIEKDTQIELCHVS